MRGNIFAVALYMDFWMVGGKRKEIGEKYRKKGKEKGILWRIFFDKVGWDMNLKMKKNRQ